MGEKRSNPRTYADRERVNKLVAEFRKDRVKKFKKITYNFNAEPFINSRGQLFCECCRETLELHMTTIWNHYTCKIHRDNKKLLAEGAGKRQMILDSIDSYQRDTGCTGVKTLTEEDFFFGTMCCSLSLHH